MRVCRISDTERKRRRRRKFVSNKRNENHISIIDEIKEVTIDVECMCYYKL
jgi:transcription elongation factor